jgi:hypothetical protein
MFSIYVDNSSEGIYEDDDTTGTSPTNRGSDVTIGAAVVNSAPTYDTFYNDLICEVQWHTTELSAAWIDEEYDQTNNNTTFWGTWSWESVGLSATSITIRPSSA